MSSILEWKERLQELYSQYSIYVDKGIQFLLALCTFLLINKHVGFMTKLTNPIIALGLAVLCAFLPISITVWVAIALMMIHLFSLSIGVAGVAFVLLFLMFIFYFRFTPKNAIVLLLTPLAFALKIPIAIPIAYGLIGTPIYMIPVLCGTLIYFMLQYAALLSKTFGDANVLTVAVQFAKRWATSKELWTVVAAMLACLLVVYIIRRLVVEHAWKIAIVSGVVVYVLIIVVGSVMFNAKIPYPTVILGSVVGMLVGAVLEILVFSVDYARTENLQFEDDEYYYYVKAIPKLSVSMPQKQVKKISVRQENGGNSTREMKENPEEQKKRVDHTDEIDIDRLIEEELLKK